VFPRCHVVDEFAMQPNQRSSLLSANHSFKNDQKINFPTTNYLAITNNESNRNQVNTMALRQVLSRILLPNFEHDLTKFIRSEFASVGNMTDTMFSPHVYAYEVAATNHMGAFSKTDAPNARSTTSQEESFAKISYPASENKGLFN
jgi:hypothetical protein